MGLPILDLDDVRIASPCNMRWEDMTGGDRVRFCAACQKSVFNLSAMKRAEARELIVATEGKICGRFYQRADGTVLTADCPVGLKLVARKAKRAAIAAAAASLGAVAAVLSFLAATPMRKIAPLPEAVKAVTVTVEKLEEKQSALVVPEVPNSMVAGGIRMPTRLEQPNPIAPTPERPHPKAKKAPKKPVAKLGHLVDLPARN